MTAVLGLIIERLAIRPMIGEPLFSIAVITLGLEAILRTIGFDAVNLNPRSLAIPWGFDGFNVGDAFVAWTYVAIYIATAIAFVAIFFFFRTRLGHRHARRRLRPGGGTRAGHLGRQGVRRGVGRERRARRRSRACSARAPRSAPGSRAPASRGSPSVPCQPSSSVGSTRSAVRSIGGLLIGCAEVFSGQYLADYTNTLGNGYSLIVPYVVMLVVLLVRPYGLFGTPEIRRV